jgi:hypothetical protein
MGSAHASSLRSHRRRDLETRQFRLSESVATRIPLGGAHCYESLYETPRMERDSAHSLSRLSVHCSYFREAFMNESQTNCPSATEAALTSSLSGTENSEKAPENTPPADEATTSAPHTQSSPPPQASKAFEIFTWIKHTIGALTHLSEANIAVAAFWVISPGSRRPLQCFHAWRSPAPPTRQPNFCASSMSFAVDHCSLRDFGGGPQGCAPPDSSDLRTQLEQSDRSPFGKPHKPGIHDRGSRISLILS